MANPLKGQVQFEAGGQRYTLRYSIDAICALEAATGKGIVGLIDELRDPTRMSLTLCRQVLWAGLREHHPELGVKEAGDLIIAAGGLLKIVELFNAAFAANFAVADGKQRPRKAGKAKAAKASTGSPSSPTGSISAATPSASGG